MTGTMKRVTIDLDLHVWQELQRQAIDDRRSFPNHVRWILDHVTCADDGDGQRELPASHAGPLLPGLDERARRRAAGLVSRLGVPDPGERAAAALALARCLEGAGAHLSDLAGAICPPGSA